MQALDREADVKTRYGGRFVQSIEGIDGDASKQRDWFWFLNGIEADRSAADYRLHAGDVEWWDFRSWRGAMRAPVVVGAFPRAVPARLRGQGAAGRGPLRAGQAAGARALGAAPARRLGRAALGPAPDGRECASYIVTGSGRFTASLRDPGGVTARRSSSSSPATQRALAAPPRPVPLPVRGPVSPVPAAALLAALAAAALLADRAWIVALIAAVLLVVCLRAPRARGAGSTSSARSSRPLSVFVLTPVRRSTIGHARALGRARSSRCSARST